MLVTLRRIIASSFLKISCRLSSSSTMVRVLNVAEKNDAAKNIANLLSEGRMQRSEGASKFNKIYSFSSVIHGQQCSMRMTSVSGHLLSLDFGSNSRKWHSCPPEHLFHLPVSKVCRPNMQPVERNLVNEAKRADWLVLWTDCDREGENIADEVVQTCLKGNKRLRILRARFSEITKRSLQRALENLGQLDLNVSKAVDVRQELDLRIGAAFTRFQTMRLQKKFPSLANQLLSYGSCQFPTMGFVVERYKAIENFVPEPFWKIVVTHEMEGVRVQFNWSRVRVFDQVAAQIFHDICLEPPVVAKVEQCNSRPKSKWRPVPMDTVELEKLGARKLRLPAKVVMQVAEKLYTSGFISYPRTETNIFPKEINLRSLVEMQTSNQQWGGFASRLLENGLTPRAGKKSDQAHPPIHPTKADNGQLNGNDARVYELIVRHFLACLSQDAVGKETTVTINLNGEKFVGHGLAILERNYLEIYIYDKWSDKEIGDYENVVDFEPSSIELVSGQTQPPPLLTEADLIALMEKHGIGTDATHAEHIETVKSRSYIGIQERDKLVPGLIGMALCEGYDAMGFEMSKPHLRAELEADLKRICEGTKNAGTVLADQIAKYRYLFLGAKDQVEKIDRACANYLNEQPVQ